MGMLVSLFIVTLAMYVQLVSTLARSPLTKGFLPAPTSDATEKYVSKSGCDGFERAYRCILTPRSVRT